MHFSRMPPTASTLPLRVISPVMARPFRGGVLRSKESRHAKIGSPAEAPSFLVAP